MSLWWRHWCHVVLLSWLLCSGSYDRSTMNCPLQHLIKPLWPARLAWLESRVFHPQIWIADPTWGPWLLGSPTLPPSGQSEHPDRPMHTSTPTRNRSVLDTFNLDGSSSLSTVTSLKERWVPSSNAASDGTVISPDLKNPKKHRDDAVHSMTLSLVEYQPPLFGVTFLWNCSKWAAVHQ